MISHLIIEALCIFPVPDIISIISIFHELFQSFFTIAQNNFESRTTIEYKLLEERIIYNIWKEHFPRIRHNESGKIWMYIRVRILERDNFDINAIIERNQRERESEKLSGQGRLKCALLTEFLYREPTNLYHEAEGRLISHFEWPEFLKITKQTTNWSSTNNYRRNRAGSNLVQFQTRFSNRLNSPFLEQISDWIKFSSPS